MLSSDDRCARTRARQRDQDAMLGVTRLVIMPQRITPDLVMPDSRIGDMDDKSDPDRRNPERHEFPAWKPARMMRQYPKVSGPGIYKPTYEHDFPVTPPPDTTAHKARMKAWSKTKAGRKALK